MARLDTLHAVTAAPDDATQVRMTRVRVGFVLLAAATAIPKAGFDVAGIPIPFMFVALFGGLFLLSETRQPPWLIDPFVLLLTAWGTLVAARITMSSSSLSEPVAVLGWLLLPLALVFLSSLRRVDGRRAMVAMFVGVRIAIAYGFVQLAFGVKEVAVPGITLAIGENLDDKPLKIFLDDFTFWKIPTTYQNGNNFGVIAACCFAIALSHPKLYRSARWQLLDLCLFLSAILLAGSRTVFIGWAISTVVIFAMRSVVDRPTTVKIVIGTVAAAVVTLALQPGLLRRFSPSSLTERSGAGRTKGWSRLVDDHSILDWIIGSTGWARSNDDTALGLTEGWGGISQQVGIIGLVLLVVVWVRYVRPVRAGFAIVIPVAVSAVVDSAYLVFPTLFIPAAFVAALTTFDHSANTGDPRLDIDHGWWIRWKSPTSLDPSPRIVEPAANGAS
jgi:hypothetical protein